jgi:Zn-dependent protease with chaperone function
MRRLLFGLCLLLSAPLHAQGPAPGATQALPETITGVLQRSQQQRLALRGAADEGSAASARVRASFGRLAAMLPPGEPVALRLVGGEPFAEAQFSGRCVAVSEAVGELPEGERLLMLAHELGHVALDHWAALGGLYRQFIPGPVRPETTDPVAVALGAQAHALSHRHEFEADAFGYGLVHKLGFGVDNAFGLLMRQGPQPDGATHPSTRRRLAQLRNLDARLGHALVHPEGATAVAIDLR